MANRGNSYHYEKYLAEYERGSAAREVLYDNDYDYDYDENDVRREQRRRKLEKLHEQRIKENARRARANKSRTRQLENSRGINFYSCILLCLAAMVLYNLAVKYIDVNSSITAKKKEVTTVQSDYDTLKAMNDSNMEKINSSIDLKEIYNVAVNDLGMVFAGNNQKIKYIDNEASYVRNFEDIPDYDSNNVIDDVINTID